MGTKPKPIMRVFSLKNFLRLFLCMLGLLVLVLFSMPLWLGWGIRTFAPDELIQFEAYEMEGYGHFRLDGDSITHPQGTVELDHLHSLSSMNWLLKSRTGTTEDFVSIGKLRVTLPVIPRVAEDIPDNSTTPQNIPEAMELLKEILQKTDTWLPQASVNHVIISKDARTVELTELSWRDRSLRFDGNVSSVEWEKSKSSKQSMYRREQVYLTHFAYPTNTICFPTKSKARFSNLRCLGFIF